MVYMAAVSSRLLVAVVSASSSPRTGTLERLDCRVGIVDSPDHFTTDVRERVHEGR